MLDEVFGEVTFDYDRYVTNKEIAFYGVSQNVEVRINVEEDGDVSEVDYKYIAF